MKNFVFDQFVYLKIERNSRDKNIEEKKKRTQPQRI